MRGNGRVSGSAALELYSIQMAYDAERTSVLGSRGWYLIRFWNNDVLGNDGVAERIVREIDTIRR